MVHPEKLQPAEGPAPEEEPKLLAKQEWFEAYLEGNLRVPQSDFGLDLMLADAVLGESEPSFQRMEESALSSEQLATMSKAMHRAHTKREIPAGPSLEEAPYFQGEPHDLLSSIMNGCVTCGKAPSLGPWRSFPKSVPFWTERQMPLIRRTRFPYWRIVE